MLIVILLDHIKCTCLLLKRSQRRTNRRIKELTFSQEEDRKNHEVDLEMEFIVLILYRLWKIFDVFIFCFTSSEDAGACGQTAEQGGHLLPSTSP